jgi:hypothetical protein
MQASRQRTWQVRLALMLILGVAAAAACVVTLMLWKAPAASGQEETSPTEPSFLVKCEFHHRDQVDPIVDFGNPKSHHMHEFFGNTTTNANSTYNTLRAGELRAMILRTQRPTGSLESPGPTAVATLRNSPPA